MEFCDKLRSLRKSRRPRLTQEELAEKLNMTQRKISRMETGETEPSLEDIRTICRYFNVSADWLLDLEVTMPEPMK